MIKSQKPSLKEILLDFLAEPRGVEYPEIELKIIKDYPLQVVDHYLDSIDISNLEREVWKFTKKKTYMNYKLVLYDWKFEFKRVPNTFDYYFDINADDFEILPDIDTIKEAPNRLAEDLDVLHYFERRRYNESRLRELRASLSTYSNESSKKSTKKKKKKRRRKKRKLRSKNKTKKVFVKVDKALSITELSNIGDCGPAEYISQSSRANTSIAETLILEDLLDLGEARSNKGVRERSRSRDKKYRLRERVRKDRFGTERANGRIKNLKNVTRVIDLDDVLNHTSPRRGNGVKRIFESSAFFDRRKKSNLKKVSRYAFKGD